MESKTHKILKRTFASKTGKTEVKIKGSKRIDAKKGHTVAEIEKSGNIKQALSRLKSQKSLHKVLRVPQKDLAKAVDLAKKTKIKVTVTNLGGTKRRIVNR